MLTASKWKFRIFPIWYNVNVYRVLTKKLIWEPQNCGSFFGKVLSEASWKYARNFLKNKYVVYEQILKHFKTRGISSLKLELWLQWSKTQILSVVLSLSLFVRSFDTLLLLLINLKYFMIELSYFTIYMA